MPIHDCRLLCRYRCLSGHCLFVVWSVVHVVVLVERSKDEIIYDFRCQIERSSESTVVVRLGQCCCINETKYTAL